jgi:hypothetical protein
MYIYGYNTTPIVGYRLYYCHYYRARVGLSVYGLNGWEVGVRFSAEVRNISLLHSVQIGSGVHLTSHAIGRGVPSLG